MKHLSLALGLVLTLAALPLTADAYTSPESVLFSPNFRPPSTRQVRQNAAKQYEERQAAQRGDPVEEFLRGAAGEEEEPLEPEEPENTVDDDAELAAQERRDQRILDRLANRDDDTLHGGAPLDEGKGGGSINSGAPLNESGPATWIIGAVIAYAVWKTLKTARA